MRSLPQDQVANCSTWLLIRPQGSHSLSQSCSMDELYASGSFKLCYDGDSLDMGCVVWVNLVESAVSKSALNLQCSLLYGTFNLTA